ncbi:methylated-DNA--cysteine S-met [Coniophora puteana RWD-64-598 SS2]|uniref:Methylated-DNA--protein-cysteine methyltransferase n=1 Tax=Coniophora puteana (strain RWD-64-598) TaxID=741705 RepID=A0A5M3MRD9_CONPW|nr:methylated-DNA--cysteine S-met [Coniophora puteana RWD-64-598 SS2]EIW81728.1 methylated-DNA--cysteine S-met [Coniophora puteana RWD-64-598 SS2]
MYYPTDAHSRRTFRTKEGKAVTPHQWAVYDFTRTIPCGRVTTYKDMCTALGEGSPRSVGTALRRNPFAPFVPCHRIVASDGSVGGFRGSWGVGKQKRDTKAPTKLLDAKGETIDNCKDKVSMLMREGVNFTPHGRLSDMNVIWRG